MMQFLIAFPHFNSLASLFLIVKWAAADVKVDENHKNELIKTRPTLQV